jgi:hypothetical protein
MDKHNSQILIIRNCTAVTPTPAGTRNTNPSWNTKSSLLGTDYYVSEYDSKTQNKLTTSVFFFIFVMQLEVLIGELNALVNVRRPLVCKMLFITNIYTIYTMHNVTSFSFSFMFMFCRSLFVLFLWTIVSSPLIHMLINTHLENKIRCIK